MQISQCANTEVSAQLVGKDVIMFLSLKVYELPITRSLCQCLQYVDHILNKKSKKMSTKNEFKLSNAERRKRRFSDSFKQKKVREIQQGKTRVIEVCK